MYEYCLQFKRNRKSCSIFVTYFYFWTGIYKFSHNFRNLIAFACGKMYCWTQNLCSFHFILQNRIRSILKWIRLLPKTALWRREYGLASTSYSSKKFQWKSLALNLNFDMERNTWKFTLEFTVVSTDIIIFIFRDKFFRSRKL